VAYNGKVLKEDVWRLTFDPESRDLEVAEAALRALKKLDCFVAESDESNFHLCSGLSRKRDRFCESPFRSITFLNYFFNFKLWTNVLPKRNIYLFITVF
jgi:hypothetical protein